MEMWIKRSALILEIGFIVSLVLLGVFRGASHLMAARGDAALMTALLLVLACSGLGMKIWRGWSTRILWEWMFIGMALLGGWVYLRWIIPGSLGTALAAMCIGLPFFWPKRAEVRIVSFWMGIAGAGIFLASALPAQPLWVLWGGLMAHDIWALRSRQSLERFLEDLATSRGVSTRLISVTGLSTQIWSSHLVIAMALIASAAWQRPLHGVLLGGALLIGAWYAIMRPGSEGAIRIVPWATVWMMGTELLIYFLT